MECFAVFFRKRTATPSGTAYQCVEALRRFPQRKRNRNAEEEKNTMTEFENIENFEAVELSAEEMNEIAGGYKPMRAKQGFTQIQIKRGDTLNRLARAYKCTVADLLKWNPQIKNKNLIYTGAYLYIKL